MAAVNNIPFGDHDLETMNPLSPLEMLASVAEKVYEFEHQFKPAATPTSEKKPLPINLNVRPRTYGRPRSSPIDIQALIPCLHQKRKLEQRDVDINDSGELGFDNKTAKKMKLTIRLQPPKLPSEYRDKITELGGSDLRFVYQTKLYKSDVSNKKDCFKMPSSNCWVDFGEIEGMQVKVYQASNEFRETMMTFTRSCVESSYVFTGSWNDIVQDSHLKKNDTVQVWSFRHGGEVSFALIKLL
ncbi:hypothetical protein vseg_020960 [Gypsophila vaccaria]